MAAAVANNEALASARPPGQPPSARVWLDLWSVLPPGERDYWRYEAPKNF